MSKPFKYKNSPSLIEKIWPTQKISAESYKEQMAGAGKTLTGLGSYWKGRKPLILNRACILGALLPATDNLEKDLEIFEMLMGMDDQSLVFRMKNSKKTQELLRNGTYQDCVQNAERLENCGEDVHAHIWENVNHHLGTSASTMPELIEQLGVMRFGKRPRVADPFTGSGQIPFEAARLGCDTYASDLSPIACMLTWGAINVIGASNCQREKLKKSQKQLIEKVQREIDTLGFEDGQKGWKAKIYLYCHECVCPQSGWKVPLLSSFIISKKNNVIAKLKPQASKKQYTIEVIYGASPEEMEEAKKGTYRDECLIHVVGGKEYRTKIATIRGDFKDKNGNLKNALRQWKKSDISFDENDIYHERLYCIQWQRKKAVNGKEVKESEFRSVTKEDLKKEHQVAEYIQKHLSDWQKKGWIPDTLIEHGAETTRLIRERGWTHWHHLFNPRQLLLCALVNRHSNAYEKLGLGSLLNYCSKLCMWDCSFEKAQNTFSNQALNTLWNYSCRGSIFGLTLLDKDNKTFPLSDKIKISINNHTAEKISGIHDIFITDPPYGDAVNYEEIYEFFISWLQKNPSKEFSDWIWDSRRSLAIKGKGENFRQGMISAFTAMTNHMSENGLQILMFTHQSTAIWSDIANIVWASGLQVTAAWYVVTETDSALREGSYVKGTVILVLRKRKERLATFRDDLAIELQDEVEQQVNTLIGINQENRSKNRDENLFSDADLQMAGYAAALRVLTLYAEIDGVDMTLEAKRPRIKGETTRVDRLIAYAVDIANQYLVPEGVQRGVWDSLKPAERFYLKMLDLEAKGHRTLDNYQNFAKAFKVRDFITMLASKKANTARLKSSKELGSTQMSGDFDMANTPLRGILYGLMELEKGVESEDVLHHLSDNIPDYMRKRDQIKEISKFLADRLVTVRPEEAALARILRELVNNERL